MSKEQQLKNCPFCGGEPKMITQEFRIGQRWGLSCCEYFFDCRAMSGEEAIAAWNTRATDDLLRQALEALENIGDDPSDGRPRQQAAIDLLRTHLNPVGRENSDDVQRAREVLDRNDFMGPKQSEQFLDSITAINEPENSEPSWNEAGIANPDIWDESAWQHRTGEASTRKDGESISDDVLSTSPATSEQPVDDVNWPEDLAHENGNYDNRCCYCRVHFQGHKRRVVCKRCHAARTTALPADGMGEEKMTRIIAAHLECIGKSVWNKPDAKTIAQAILSALPNAPLGGVVETAARAIEREVHLGHGMFNKFGDVSYNDCLDFAKAALAALSTSPDEQEVVKQAVKSLSDYTLKRGEFSHAAAQVVVRALMARYNLVRKG